MKKRLFAVLVGMLLCCNIFAQKEPGTMTLYPRVGLNLSKFSGDKIYRESFYGIFAKIGIQPEFRVSNKHDAILNKVNCSIPIGLSYEYHNIAFDIRYNLGLTHVYKNMTDNAHNSTLMFTLGYGIDL